MARTRTLAALATSALLAVGGTAHATSGGEAHASGEAATVLPGGPAHPPAGRAWIQGVVTDQAGHARDGVNVEAHAVDAPGSAPVASSLTYADPDDSHPHGFFRLFVPAGKYQVVLSATGSREDGDGYRLQWYADRQNLTVLTRQVRDLGSVALVHQGRVASTTTARLLDATVPAGEHGVLRLAVASAFVSPVTGRVSVVVDGDRLAPVPLTEQDGGAARVRLPLLAPGAHDVVVTFVGTPTVKGSAAAPVRLTVRRKHHH